MIPITYGITEERYALGGESRLSYGIAAYACPQTDGTKTILTAIRDITSDKEKLLNFVETCNRLALAVEHLPDAVEDLLGE